MKVYQWEVFDPRTLVSEAGLGLKRTLCLQCFCSLDQQDHPFGWLYERGRRLPSFRLHLMRYLGSYGAFLVSAVSTEKSMK